MINLVVSEDEWENENDSDWKELSIERGNAGTCKKWIPV